MNARQQQRQQEDVERITRWIEAAYTAGWSMRRTYDNEPIEQACTLERDGWKAMAFLRPNNVSLSVWGPDGLAIALTKEYDEQRLQAALRICSRCGTEDVETVRLGFAGRVCAPCRVKHAPDVERPGWYD